MTSGDRLSAPLIVNREFSLSARFLGDGAEGGNAHN